jgi:hypothetical protein
MTEGGSYFHETFVRHHSNLTKYIVFIVFLWFMTKLRKYLLFLLGRTQVLLDTVI